MIRARHGEKWTFTRVHNAILESDRTTIEKAVYWTLCYFADQEGFCFPSYATIAKMASCSKRSAISAIESLEKYGWLTKEKRTTDNGDQTSNGYVIHSKPVVQEVHDPYATVAPPLVQEVHPNENHINESQVNNGQVLTLQFEDSSEKQADYEEQVDSVIGYFNQQTGKSLSRQTKRYRNSISKAFAAGYTYDQLTAIIDNVAEEWPGRIPDSKLTPEIVFRPSKMQERLEFAEKSAEKRNRSSLSIEPPPAVSFHFNRESQ